jgi:catechol 2,3-dioxygenase-like lactoylglutathione lyase family enzyme
MKQKISIITLGVADLHTSRKFYEETLKFNPVDKSDNIVFYDMGTVRLALFQCEELAKDANVSHEGYGFKGFTLAHNLGSPTEVDGLFKSLEQAGVTIVKHPQKVFWGGYSGYFADLDSNLWEVAYNPFTDLT